MTVRSRAVLRSPQPCSPLESRRAAGAMPEIPRRRRPEAQAPLLLHVLSVFGDDSTVAAARARSFAEKTFRTHMFWSRILSMA